MAFDDARALLAYRYQNNYHLFEACRSVVSQQLSDTGRASPFDNIDDYSDGPLQTTPAPINEVGVPVNRDNPTLPWAGADNTNQFFRLAGVV